MNYNEYKVVEASSIEGLASAVEEEMTDQWKPQGGVCRTAGEYEEPRKGYTESWEIYSQAMVRTSWTVKK